MSFEDFIKKFHPHILIEYERSLVPWDDIKPGVIVITLRSGFGGGPGSFRRVTEHHEKNEHWECRDIESLKPDRNGRKNVGILLRHSDADDWRDEHWWQDVVIVDHVSIISLPSGEQIKYIDDLIKGRRVR